MQRKLGVAGSPGTIVDSTIGVMHNVTCACACACACGNTVQECDTMTLLRLLYNGLEACIDLPKVNIAVEQQQ